MTSRTRLTLSLKVDEQDADYVEEVLNEELAKLNSKFGLVLTREPRVTPGARGALVTDRCPS